jgi:uncharacterized integral membrane protein
MPWRLLLLIIILGIVFCFIGFNLENRCDISFGPGALTIKQVPVYLTVFGAFVLGLLCSLPLAISARSKKPRAKDAEKKPKKQRDPKPDQSDAYTGDSYGID